VATINFVSELTLELRYKRQEHSLRIVPGLEADDGEIKRQFDLAYARRYGHSDPGNSVEVVGIHVGVNAITERPDLQSLARREPHPEPRVYDARPVYFHRLTSISDLA
jgi:N-methylhydantoinase A/oxoprolinase/acetone carboxylase beta subunit